MIKVKWRYPGRAVSCNTHTHTHTQLSRKYFFSTFLAGLFFISSVLLSACGGGGGGSSDPVAPAVPSSSDLLGNFKLVYTLDQLIIRRFTFNIKSTDKTSEGTDIYGGADADNPSIFVGGAWYPSLARFVLAAGPVADANPTDAYLLVIESDNRLTGCHNLYLSDGSLGACNELDSSQSHKYPAGQWARSARVQTRSLTGFSRNPAQLPVGPDMEKAVAELSKVISANRP